MSDINAINFQVTPPATSATRPETGSTSTFVKKANSDFQDLVRQIARDKAAAEKAEAAKERADTAANKAAQKTTAKTIAKTLDKTADKTIITAEQEIPEAILNADAENSTLIATEADTDPEPETTPSVAFDLSGSGDTMTLDANGLKTLKAALDNMLHGLPADQKPVAIKLNIGQLQKALQDLKTNAGDIQDNEKSLIATGLSPEQLTKLSALIAQASNIATNAIAPPIEDTTADDSLKAVLVGILKLVPDESAAEPQTIFLPKTLMVSRDEKPAKDLAKDKDNQGETLVTSMNTMIVTEQTPPPAPATPMDTSGVKEGGIDSGAIAPEKKGGFDDVLKMFEQPQPKSATPGKSFGTDAATGQKASTETASAGNSTTSFSRLFGSMATDGSLDGSFPDGLDWSKNNQFGLSNVQVTNPAQLTSLVTQTTATQSHPATQIVAATLARTFEGGESKSLTLRLDPPELGKIEIHMQFTKDKSVKTHMIFEKPETMLMMQRDQNALQQSLQDAGMNGDGNGLSFELASQDNSPFSGNQGGNGNNGRSTGGDEPQIIETTMSWSVDANTGMKHYNVLV